jgi:F-type H+-transporting ATPase subunit gamma
VKTGEMLREVTVALAETESIEAEHPLLARREEKRALTLVITSDRGLCGAFNANILRAADRMMREKRANGIEVSLAVIGRKGRDYFQRRSIALHHVFSGVWEKLDIETARRVARTVVAPFLAGEVDAIYLVYNEFKSAMSQRVVAEALFPLEPPTMETASDAARDPIDKQEPQFLFEPDKQSLLERLVPMYVEATIARALLESLASQLGAQMTAMDSATKNATEMIGKLTLDYNRARQAAITTELMEIIGGAEALRD